MRAIWGATFAAATMGFAVWLGAANSGSAPAGAEPIALPGSEATPSPNGAYATATASGAGRYLGVGSCASAACHGGPVSADRSQKWRSSYTVWAALDKHSRAYSVLFEKRSRQIVKLLDHLPDVEQAKPYEDERCLACHSAGQTGHSTSNVAADGVGCELCHGPAQNWLTRHTERAWLDSRSTPNFTRLSGMTDTRNLVTRATTCAGCHVGSPAEYGRPARDVNHDLIAAGHPRLNFEFHAYLGVMPKHWTDTPGAKPNYKTDEETHATAWAVGQAVSAEAALRLKAGREKSAKTLHGIEFSDFDCYACHHELSTTFPSQRQLAAESNRSSRQPGTLPTNAWYFLSPRFLFEAHLLGSKSQQNIEMLKQLVDGDSSPKSTPAVISQQAAAMADSMHQLAELAGSITWDAARVNELLARASDTSTMGLTWDAAAQRFLAVEALISARRQLRVQAGLPADPSDPEIDRGIAQIRTALAFPLTTKDGLASEMAGNGSSRVDSPRGYDPIKIRESFERLFDSLRKSMSVEAVK
jgi:Cytochrome c554 and c-prime